MKTITKASTFFSGAMAGIPWMLLSAFMFSIMACFVRLSKGHLLSEEIIFYRSLPSAIILAVWAVIMARSLKTTFPQNQLVRGILGTLAMFANFYALESSVPIGICIALSYTYPLFFVLINGLWYRQKIALSVIACVLLGFTGVLLIAGGDAYGVHAMDMPLDGIVAGLLGGFFSALSYFNVRSLAAKGEAEWRTVFYFSLTGGVSAVLWSAIHMGLMIAGIKPTLPDGSFLHNPFTDPYLLFLITGLTVSGLGMQLFVMRAFRQGDMNITGMFAYSSLIFSTLFGLWVFDETFGLIPLIGMGLIGISGMLMTWFKRRAVS